MRGRAALVNADMREWIDPGEPLRQSACVARLSTWTAQRATAPGIIAGLAAGLLWPAFAAYPHIFLWPFAATLAVAGFCGLSILVLSVIDVRNRRRGKRVRPIRAFDVVVGLALALPSAFELSVLLG